MNYEAEPQSSLNVANSPRENCMNVKQQNLLLIARDH